MPSQKDLDLVKKWKGEIDRYDRYAKQWRGKAKKITKRYRDERSRNSNDLGEDGPRFNLFWSMVETFRTLIYSRCPVPDCSRRYKDDDPVGRVASEMLERAVTFMVQSQPFNEVMRAVVRDYLLVGRGTAWEFYEPTFDKDEDVEKVVWEHVRTGYVHWDDFCHSPDRVWDEVWWVGHWSFMTRKELTDRFGNAIGNKVPLNYTNGKEEAGRSYTSAEVQTVRQARVCEIWDSRSRKAIWIAEGYNDEPLDVQDDPLGLERFYPCPMPLFSTLTNDSLIPVPDFLLIQDQLDEMDDITSRISIITKALKVAGVCDASVSALQRLLEEGTDNQLIPVENWKMFTDKGGIEGSIAWMPIEQAVNTLVALYDARDRTKDVIYEVSGMADVIRGMSEPDETAAAQRIKGRWAGSRIGARQTQVQEFARDLVRITAEIIAEQFGADTLMEMTNIQLPSADDIKRIKFVQQLGAQLPPEHQAALQQPTIDDIMEMLKKDNLRSFRIDIETDSTIAPDEDQEKQDRMELVQSIGQMLNQVLPVVQAIPALAPAMKELIMFTLRGFKASRSVEAAFETSLNDAVNQAGDSSQQTDPKVQAAQLKAQSDAQKAGVQLQTAKLKAQAQLQDQAMQNEIESRRLDYETQKAQDDHRLKAAEILIKAGQPPAQPGAGNAS